MEQYKLVHDCFGTTVKNWGRVDLCDLDYSAITDHKVECWIGGLWHVQFYLPQDFFRLTTVEVQLEVRGVCDRSIDREIMEGKTLVLDEEATRSMQVEAAENLW